MTVPGQAFYEASRKSVLKGADGIVFVADSQIPLLDANLENFDGLRRNCLEHNIDLNQIPLVFQYNKRDLNYLIPVETFNNLLNPRRLPFVEAAAINGVGVFESLREISKLTVPVVREKILGEKRKEAQKLEIPEERPEDVAERRERAREEVEFVTPDQASPVPGDEDQDEVPEGDRERAREDLQGIRDQGQVAAARPFFWFFSRFREIVPAGIPGSGHASRVPEAAPRPQTQEPRAGSPCLKRWAPLDRGLRGGPPGPGTPCFLSKANGSRKWERTFFARHGIPPGRPFRRPLLM